MAHIIIEHPATQAPSGGSGRSVRFPEVGLPDGLGDEEFAGQPGTTGRHPAGFRRPSFDAIRASWDAQSKIAAFLDGSI